jgi:Outer membrane protein and related peptidoglycan-associated (lipo)proteins
MATLSVARFFGWVARFMVLIAFALGVACATQNPALERARQAYAQAEQNPVVTANAAVALHEAGQTLRQAEQAEDQEEMEHLAYLAEKKVEIARTEAQKKMAEANAERLLKERDQVRLEARTREAEEATAVAEAATAQAIQLEEELSELKAKKTERGYVLSLGDVLFDYDKASLKAGAQQNLYQVVTFLREHPEQYVSIEGHTDSTGSESYNLGLSQRRAQAVQDFLLYNGISPERISARGYGEAYPVVSNDTAAGQLQNRRVEIVFLEEGKPVAVRR